MPLQQKIPNITQPSNRQLSAPTIYMNYTWKVYDDTCGYDHFPINVIIDV